MVLIAVTCPYCQSDHITKRGKTDTDKQRYRCHNPHCPHQSFLLHPAYKGRLPAIKSADYRHGSQWQRYPRHRTRLGHQH